MSEKWDPWLQYDLAGSTQTFRGILVTSREVNTISSTDCDNVGGRAEKCK